MKSLFPLVLFLSVFTVEVASQPVADDAGQDLPDPKVAFLKSLAVPGWGHYYVNQSDWRRGQYHLAAEAALVLSYIGFSIHSNNLQQNWYAYSRAEAGISIEDRSRRLQLAVGDFNSLEAYNDYQLRSRNWDQLFADIPENRWSWSGDAERSEYNGLRSRFETIDQQLPALLALMAVNRVISGISAYNRAQKRIESNSVRSSLYLSPYQFSSGLVANVKVEF
jgi:hypothetical protein